MGSEWSRQTCQLHNSYTKCQEFVCDKHEKKIHHVQVRSLLAVVAI